MSNKGPTAHVLPQDSSAAYVDNLRDIGAADLARVGGKGANLGELIRAGFPVPPGFVITTVAYEQIVAANAIAALIPRAISTGDGGEVRAAFAKAAIPPDIQSAILFAYQRLGAGSVAVRSSATAEDLPDAAFAGQQDSFLGIIDEQGLLDAVRRCWGSLWSDRAISYRDKYGFSQADVRLAVVVQQLVTADAAGVMFTANPISGARDETVIDACAGLGEAIVSGLVTPDHVVLRKRRFRWRIIERVLGRHEVEIRPLAGGGVAPVSGVAAPYAVLDDAALRRLAGLGAKIAAHFGRPQDIEWTWSHGRFAVVQARPITALPAEPAPRGPLGMPRGGPSEYLSLRPYPLDVTSWIPAVTTALMRMFPIGRSVPSFDQIWIEEDGVITRLTGFPGIRPSPDLLLLPPRLIALAVRYNPARWRDDPILGRLLQRVQDLEARDVDVLPVEALLATMREAMALPMEVAELRRRYFPRAVLSMLGLRLVLGLVGREKHFGDLLTGVDNKTLEANRRLEALASDIRAAPELAATFADHDPTTLWDALASSEDGRAFLAKLRQFLASYGHRETGSPLLISLPTWKDAPEPVLGILKGLAQGEPARRTDRPRWEVMRDDILALPEMEFAPLRGVFLALLTGARQFPSLREDTHFLMTMPMPVMRRASLELGRRLVDANVLANRDEVFHLRLDELERAAAAWPPSATLQLELKAAADQRAARREALADTPIMELPAQPVASPTGDVLLMGTPGSPGVAEGPVRLITSAAEFGKLQPGEVLVAPYTNPAWTPLFGRAVAVIVDAGSAMSHAAIVAREYGIPAVMGTGDAMNQLHDGQVIRVDGTHGRVSVAEPATAHVSTSGG